MWNRHQRRPATGDEADQQIVFTKSAHQFEGFFSSPQAIFIGDGMPARLDVESTQGLDGSLFWNEQAAGRKIRKQVNQGQSHGVGGFSQSKDANPSNFVQKIFLLVDEEDFSLAMNKAADSLPGLHSLDGRTKNTCDGLAARVTGESVSDERFRTEHGGETILFCNFHLYRTRSQIALFQKVGSAICDRGYYREHPTSEIAIESFSAISIICRMNQFIPR